MPHTTTAELLNEVTRLRRRVGELEQEHRRIDAGDEPATRGPVGAASYQTGREHSLLDALPCAVCECDLSGTILFANTTFAELHGYPQDELKGRNYADLVTDERDRAAYLGYKVAYKCPYCSESLTSQESEIIDEEECPECGEVFKVAESALSMIESLKEQHEAKRKTEPVIKTAELNNKNISKSEKAGSDSSHTFNFKNHVPSEHVRELNASYDGCSINVTLEIIKSGNYLIAGGKVGGESPSGHDTFRWGTFKTKTISGVSGDLIPVSIPIRLLEGYWAIGIFKRHIDIETSRIDKSVSAFTNSSDLIVPATIGIIAVFFIGSVVLTTMSGSSSSYSSRATRPAYNSTGSGSSSSDSDTSEFSRRLVTDQMIRQGADPVEAEAFTSELYKAQREWERNKK